MVAAERIVLGGRHLGILQRAAFTNDRLNAAKRLLGEIRAGNISLHPDIGSAAVRAALAPLGSHADAALAAEAQRALLKIDELYPAPTQGSSGPTLEDLLSLRAGIDPADGSPVLGQVKAGADSAILTRISAGEITWADIEVALDCSVPALRAGAFKMIKSIKPATIKGEDARAFLGDLLLNPLTEQATKDLIVEALDKGYGVKIDLQPDATDARVAELTDLLQAAEGDLASARAEESRLTAQLAQVIKSRDDLKVVVDRKVENIDALRSSLRDAGIEKSALEKQLSEAQEHVRNVEASKDGLAKELETARAKVASTEAVFDAMASDAAADKSALEARLQKSAEDLAAARAEAEAARARVASTEAAFGEMVNEVGAEKSALEASLQKSAEDLAAARIEAETARAQVAPTLEQELTRLSGELEAVTTSIADFDGRLTALLSQKETEVDTPLNEKRGAQKVQQERLAELQRITSERENAFRSALEGLSARESTLREEKERLSSQPAAIEMKFTEAESEENREAETLLLCLASVPGTDSTKVALTEKVAQIRAAATARTIQEATAQADAGLVALAEERKQLTDRHLAAVMSGKTEYPELIQLDKVALPALSAAITDLESKLAELSGNIAAVEQQLSANKDVAREKVARVNEIKATLISDLKLARSILRANAAYAAEKAQG